MCWVFDGPHGIQSDYPARTSVYLMVTIGLGKDDMNEPLKILSKYS